MNNDRKKFNIDKYDEYVKEFINMSIDAGSSIPFGKLRFNNLPDGRWFIRHCPDKNVDSWFKFVTWCGLGLLTKEQCIKKILEMSKRYNSPLKYDDFRGHECGKVTIHMINTYWGSLNKMKEDLGLEIVQQNMDKLTHDSFIRDMEYIKLYLEENNKDFITEEEIDSINEIHRYCCLNKYIKNNYNTSFSDYCAINGIQTGKCGRGIEYKFEDGEKNI